MKETSRSSRVSERTVAQVVAELTCTVSASRLSLFQSCRLRFFFRYVLGLTRPKAAALHLGGTVHQVLRAWNRARWKQELPSWGSLYAAYEEAWIIGQADEPVAWESPSEQDQQKQVGWRLLETFFRETSIRTTDKAEAVEVQVEADLSVHGLPRLVGVLDLVQDGRIIDFKTAGQTPSAEKAALLSSTQVTAYSILYRENTGQQEAGIELHHLVKLKAPRLVVRTPASAPVVPVTPAAASTDAQPDQPTTLNPTVNQHQQPGERHTTAMQNGTTNQNNNGNGQQSVTAHETTSPEEKPSLEQALDQIESLKGSLRGAVSSLNTLADTLRQVQRERRLSEREVRSVRDTLKSLQTVRL